MLKNKNKTCTFYASDYHFEMIILPYVNKKIDENNNIVIFTENNLKESIDILISKMNLNKDKKEKILNLDWESNDSKKFNFLEKCKKDPKGTVVFVKGTQNYIKDINEKINEDTKQSNVKVVDCYFVDDLKANMIDITSQYQNYLNTSGETAIN